MDVRINTHRLLSHGAGEVPVAPRSGEREPPSRHAGRDVASRCTGAAPAAGVLTIQAGGQNTSQVQHSVHQYGSGSCWERRRWRHTYLVTEPEVRTTSA
eukprot:scaffold7095_cov386-Prasinococcus_capsulatus_cf.AAC.6